MKAKDELMRVRDLGKQIDLTAQLLAGYRARAEKTTQVLTGMSNKAGVGDKVSGYAALIVDGERQLIKMQDEYRILVVDVNKTLAKMGNKTHVNVLQYRYLLGLAWPAVADALHYSLRYTTKLHGWALLEYDACRQ